MTKAADLHTTLAASVKDFALTESLLSFSVFLSMFNSVGWLETVPLLVLGLLPDVNSLAASSTSTCVFSAGVFSKSLWTHLWHYIAIQLCRYYTSPLDHLSSLKNSPKPLKALSLLQLINNMLPIDSSCWWLLLMLWWHWHSPQEHE